MAGRAMGGEDCEAKWEEGRLCKYGKRWGVGVDEGTAELWHFANQPVEGVGRFGHLRASIDLIWNKHFPNTILWNDWVEEMLQEFCDTPWVTVTGPGACISKDTRILNPLTNEQPTVGQLLKERRQPVVMTLCGPVLASVPFLKGETELYEVTLTDGSRFTSTLKHLVLKPSGDYIPVSSLATGSRLLGYELGRQRSISGSALLTPASGERGFRKKEPDFQSCCRPEYRYDDELLQEATVFFQDTFPSPACAQEHAPFPQPIISRILRASHGGPLSSLDFLGLLTQTQTSSSPRFVEEILLPDAGSCRSFCQSSSKNVPLLQAQKQAHNSAYKHCHTPAYLKIQEKKVVGVRCIGKQNYYDISVPGIHHYFAQGAIHHNSWKTTCASIYVVASWFASPHNTIVVCTSTTLPGLRRRIFKEITRFYRLRPAIGNFIPSKDCIQFAQGSDEAGIFGLATEEGQLKKALGKIIGFHNTNVIVVVDEMPYTPEAIVEACVNLESGATRFQFIGLGNADDQLDPHGRMCEPRGGWDSVDVESKRWETKRGVCIHLDGLDSPNIKAGKNIYPGLLTQRDIENTSEIYGIDSPQFWQMRRGFWAPEGVQKTVLTMPIITKARAQEQPVFDSNYTLGAALDPAFEGGDRCVLRFGKCGHSNGKKILALSEIIFVKTKTSPDDPAHYQIVRQVKEECSKRGVPPYFFALDSTGEGGGLLSIFQREWSPQVLGVEFGGRPSRYPVSQTNPKRADQEYDRRVTELWFRFRILVQCEQIKGLDYETATEFCRRWYDMKGPYISIETKAKMKERTLKSPDLADNAVVMSELFFLRDHLKPARLEIHYDSSDNHGWRAFQKQRSLSTLYEPAL